MIQRIKNNPFAKNSLILFIGTMVNNVLNYVFHLAVGRLVSIEVYGETESLISLMTIISVPAATIIMVAAKYSAECKARDNKKRSYELLKYFNRQVAKYGTTVFLLAALFTPWISHFLNIKSNIPLLIVWSSMLLSLFSAGAQGMLNGWQKFESTGWSAIWGGLLKLLSAILFIAVGLKVNGLMLSFFISAASTYIVALISLKFIFEAGKNDKHEIEALDFSSMKNTVITFFLGNLAINVLGNMDMVLAKHNLSSLEAGQYGALTIVSKIIFFATGVVATVLFSMSAEHNHKKGDTKSLFTTAFCAVLGLSLTATAIYFAMPKFILSILFGSKYNSVAPYLGWFAVMVVAFSLVNLTIQYLLSLRKVSVVYGTLAIAAISAIVMMFFGRTISAILMISTLGQVLALAASLPFVFKSMKSSKET